MSTGQEFETAEQLARALFNVDASARVKDLILQQFDSIVPVAIAIGICFVLTVQCFANRYTKNRLQKILLLSVGAMTLGTFTLMCVDRRHMNAHVTAFADVYHFDSTCIIICFMLCTICTYLAQIFFGLRAYRLWGRRIRLMIPVIVTAHIALLSGLAFDICRLTQPEFSSTTTGEELREVARWFAHFDGARRPLQLVWLMSTVVCDLIICCMIVFALVRLKNNTFLTTTKCVLQRSIILIMESMVPPMLFALLYAVVIASGSMGPSSWFRNTGAYQSVSYWFAIVWVLTTQHKFKEELLPTTRTRERGQQLHVSSSLQPAKSTTLGTSNVCAKSNPEEGQVVAKLSPGLLVQVQQYRQAEGDESEHEHTFTLEEALQGPEALYRYDEKTDQA